MSKLRHQLRRTLDGVELDVFTRPGSVGADEVGARLAEHLAQGGDDAHRAQQLADVARGSGDRGAYLHEHGACGVRRFVTAGRAVIYRLAVETFPDHVNNVYLVRDGARTTLYDCGSQTSTSKDDLDRGGRLLGELFGETSGLEHVEDLVISHAHIDHFGGVGRWRKRGARVHVHEFDARVLTRFEERIVTAAMQVRVFLERSGLDAAARAELEQMYVFTKHLFRSVPVDRILTDGDEVNGWVLHHAPGHCPGQVCMQVENVLLTADHVLPRITPHQSPESITPWTGLDHYLIALDRFRHIGGVDLALPGHEEPIPRLHQRINEIEAFHKKRLGDVHAQCAEPHSIAEIAARMFGEQRGYGRLLALEEAAAHVEYLARRGTLEIDNLDELMAAPNPVLRYRAGQKVA